MKKLLLLPAVLALALVSGCPGLKPRPEDPLHDVPRRTYVRVTLLDPSGAPRYVSYLVDVHAGKVVDQREGDTRQGLPQLQEEPSGSEPQSDVQEQSAAPDAGTAGEIETCASCVFNAGEIVLKPGGPGPVGHEDILALARRHAAVIAKLPTGFRPKLTPQLPVKQGPVLGK